jgi:type VI secretion system protein ImpA
MIDVQSLLKPVSEEAPAGRSLEYSPEYLEFERLCQGPPNRMVGHTAAEPPDPGLIIERATALLRSSKDLRIALELARALLKRDSLAGFAHGLAFVRDLLAIYWPSLHPQLDEEDGDPTVRIYAMAALTQGDTLRAIRAAPLVTLSQGQVLTLRDVDASVPAALLSWITFAELAAAAGAAEACDREARELEIEWRAQLEAAGFAVSVVERTPDDLTELRQLLARALRFLTVELERRKGLGGSAPAQANEAAPPPSSALPPAASHDLASSEDVLRALDSICTYYARKEPLSPVPLILERCKRLVAMPSSDPARDMLATGHAPREDVR